LGNRTSQATRKFNKAEMVELLLRERRLVASLDCWLLIG